MDALILEILDKQLSIIGVEGYSFKKLSEDPLITIKEGKKEVTKYWYDHFFFSEEQYNEWKEWAKPQISEEEWIVMELLFTLNWKLNV